MFGKPFAEQIRRGKPCQPVQAQDDGNLFGREAAGLQDEGFDIAVCRKVGGNQQDGQRLEQHEVFTLKQFGQAFERTCVHAGQQRQVFRQYAHDCRRAKSDKQKAELPA